MFAYVGSIQNLKDLKAELRERERWMYRGPPQAVENVVVQGHMESDSSPLGSTLVQLLAAIASTYSSATARP